MLTEPVNSVSSTARWLCWRQTNHLKACAHRYWSSINTNRGKKGQSNQFFIDSAAQVIMKPDTQQKKIESPAVVTASTFFNFNQRFVESLYIFISQYGHIQQKDTEPEGYMLLFQLLLYVLA